MLNHLQVNCGLVGERRTVRAARILGMPPEEMAGWLMQFWDWCSRNDVLGDGRLPAGVEDCDIETSIHWRPERGRFMEALRLEGFVSADGEIAGWKKRYGPYFDELEKSRERARRHRDKARGSAAEEGLGDGADSPNVRRTCGVRTDVDETRRDETRGEEMKTIVDAAPLARSFVVSLFSRWVGKEAEKQAARLITEAGVERARVAAKAFEPQLRVAKKPGALLQAWLDRRGWESDEPWSVKDGAPAHERKPPDSGPAAERRRADPESDRAARLEAERQRQIAALAKSMDPSSAKLKLGGARQA